MEICMHNDFVYFHTKLVGVVHRFSRRASNINNNKTEHNHRKKNPNERAYMPIAHLKTDNRSILWWLIWDKESTMAILSCCLLWNLMTFQWKEAAEKIHPSIYIVYIAFLLHFYNMMYLCVCACVQEDNEKHVLEQHKHNALHQQSTIETFPAISPTLHHKILIVNDSLHLLCGILPSSGAALQRRHCKLIKQFNQHTTTKHLNSIQSFRI